MIQPGAVTKGRLLILEKLSTWATTCPCHNFNPRIVNEKMEIQRYLKDEFAVNGDVYRQTVKHLAMPSNRVEITRSPAGDTSVLFKRCDWIEGSRMHDKKRAVFTWLSELYWAAHMSSVHQTLPEFKALSDEDQAYVTLVSDKLSLLCREQWLKYAGAFDRPQVYLGGALRRLMAMREKRTPSLQSAGFHAVMIDRCNAEKDDIINSVNEKIGLSSGGNGNESANGSER